MPTCASALWPHDKRTTSPIRVQVGVNFFLGHNRRGRGGMEAARAARRTIYEWERKCVAALEILASECRLEAINVKRQPAGRPQMEGFSPMAW